jgi:hypothetical protein
MFLVGPVHASGNAVAGGTMLGDGLLQRLYPEVSAGPLHIFAFAVLGLLVLGATRARLGLPRGHARGGGPRMSRAAGPSTGPSSPRRNRVRM